MTQVVTRRRARDWSVDLKGHHSLCEMNFHRFIQLMPGLDGGRRSWTFNTVGPLDLRIDMLVIETAPYTTTVDVLQTPGKASFIKPARMRIRLYHDVEMAEVVGWNRHRHWLPQYDYPNKHMYHPDEKLSLNRFLGDWLSFCRKHGLLGGDISHCDGVRDNDNKP